MSKGLRLLITAYDYRPQLGGIATCSFELSRALSALPEVKVRVIARESENSQEVDAIGAFETIRLPLPGSSVAAALILGAAVSAQVLRWKPHAVLNFIWLPCGIATCLSPARLLTGTPFFVFAHGVEVMESSRTVKKRLRRLLAPLKKHVFQKAHGVFAVSSFTKDLVSSLCETPYGRVMVVNNGVDPGDFFPEAPSKDLVRQYGLEGKRVFLTMARLDDYKGVDRVIEAMGIVIQKFPEATYLVCGEGGDRPRLQRKVSERDLGKHVVFAGAVPFARRRDYYNLCECFIMLSRLDEKAPNVEGFGISFLEAAACGKPSIGGRSGGVPEAVISGKTGWTVDPNDENEIAGSMIRCLEDPLEAKTLGLQARQWATESMTWIVAAHKVLQEIQRHLP